MIHDLEGHATSEFMPYTQRGAMSIVRMMGTAVPKFLTMPGLIFIVYGQAGRRMLCCPGRMSRRMTGEGAGPTPEGTNILGAAIPSRR